MPVSDFSLVRREYQKAREGGLPSGVAEGDPLVSQKKGWYPSLTI